MKSTTTGRAARIRGFSLLELLITMSLAAILLTIAVPSFRYVTNSNRIAGEVNGLLGDLQFARAEAIKEGRYVTVCVSTDGQNCNGSTAWQEGWIVFSDPTDVGVNGTGETPLRLQKTFSSTDTFLAQQNVAAITFNREGYAVGVANGGALLELRDLTGTAAWTRCLYINLSGQMTTELSGVTTNGVTCS
jgi:type IV fimbrial biogenesis protein FimT